MTNTTHPINWKHLSSTDGYKSLKAAYIRDVQDAAKRKRPLRDKEEFLKHFQWVISRAIHYAHHTQKPIEHILNEWEEKRDYGWLNYYQDCRQPRFHSNSLKRRCLRVQKPESTKTKPRWSTEWKKHIKQRKQRVN